MRFFVPVDTTHIHADIPHEKTVQRSDFLYSCNSVMSGDARPRGRPITSLAQDGWTDDGRRRIVEHVTHWKSLKCGTTYEPVMGPCEGCANDPRRP